jgi:hypothetical protein
MVFRYSHNLTVLAKFPYFIRIDKLIASSCNMPLISNTALMQLFGRIGSFEKAVIFSDSSAAIQSIAKLDALSSKRVAEIN